MSEITISAVVKLKNDRDPEIVDNSIQVININKIQNANISIEINKIEYKFIYSPILNGYVCDKCMILYIQTKWVFIFSCNISGTKQPEIYYCYNNNGSNDKVDTNDIIQLFRSAKIAFYNNNVLIDKKNTKFKDICTFFGSKVDSSNLHSYLENAKIRVGV